MTPIVQEQPTKTAWYEEICQQLDALRDNAKAHVDECEKAPSDERFEKVKEYVMRLRTLADYPNLPEAEVWIGPNQQIVITFETSEAELDLIFSNKLTARLTIGKQQSLLKQTDIPKALQELAA